MKMNDGMLSQDEIDALLNISEEKDIDVRDDVNDFLTSIEIDTLGEIGNISLGSSATSLSTLLNQKVDITTPQVDIVKRKELDGELTFEPVSVGVEYIEGFSGNNIFVIKATDAAIIADIMLGGNGSNPEGELTEIHLSAVQEAMNQMMGAAATSMSTVFNKRIDISPPTIIDSEAAGFSNQQVFTEDTYVKVFFKLTVGNLIDSNMMQLIPLRFAKDMVDELLTVGNTVSEAVVETPVEKPAVMHPQAETGYPSSAVSAEERQQPSIMGRKSATSHNEVQEAAFADFEKVELNNNEQRNLEMLLDIPLKVTVELGRTKKSIRDILDLSSGSIVELDKLAGEPVDILVNEKLVAEGEVVVIEENFGVRVTDIISQSDRLMKLK